MKLLLFNQFFWQCICSISCLGWFYSLEALPQIICMPVEHTFPYITLNLPNLPETNFQPLITVSQRVIYFLFTKLSSILLLPWINSDPQSDTADMILLTVREVIQTDCNIFNAKGKQVKIYEKQKGLGAKHTSYSSSYCLSSQYGSSQSNCVISISVRPKLSVLCENMRGRREDGSIKLQNIRRHT